jgi:hypothetical protein
MKTVALVLAPVATVAAVAAILPWSARAAGADFDSVVSAVEHQYSTRAQRVPMMGLVSLCAHVASHGGVRGMKIAEFDHLSAPDTEQLESVVRRALGDNWQPFVTERERNGNVSIIYVQPSGSDMRMLIANYEHGELNLVRMQLNGDRLARWMHDPEGSAHQHHYASDHAEAGKGSPD